jgi:hypothetical protein
MKIAGVHPGNRGPFEMPKGPKTILASAWSGGSPSMLAESSGAQTRFSLTMPA